MRILDDAFGDFIIANGDRKISLFANSNLVREWEKFANGAPLRAHLELA